MKKSLSLFLALSIGAVLSGCSGKQNTETTVATETTSEIESTTQAETQTTKETLAETETQTDTKEESKTKTTSDASLIRIGSLKGPTSMGLVHMMDTQSKKDSADIYEFTMVTAADELLAKVAAKELDIALVPANVASVLYNKTKGGISAIDINTLGVLDIVASDDSIHSITDLKGKTVYLTGKGTSPDYVINYLLTANGLTADDVKLEFKSEAAEVAAVLKEQPDAIGLLPQPFVTAACAQNENLKIVLDLTKEWQAIQGENGSQLVTGVTIVRNEFLTEQQPLVEQFLKEHKDSAAFANENPDEASELIAELGIIEKAPIAKKALPYCNITCLTGEEMKAALSGYLQVLFEQNPQSIGGAIPEDDFYFIP